MNSMNEFLNILLQVFSLEEGENEEKHEMNANMIAECQKQENASDDDVTSIQNMEEAQTQSGKCMHACMGEKLNFVS